MTGYVEPKDLKQQAPLAPTGDISPLVELGKLLQKEASVHNIHNVFDDGGYKELLLMSLFNLKKLNRTGDDAVDEQNRQYEIKTVARISSSGKRKKSLSVTTEHTLTRKNIERYRAVHLWIVAVFDQAEPEAIYEITPLSLEPKFQEWEAKLATQEQRHTEGGATVHLNNPKISLKFIAEHGTKVWPSAPS
ncbi:hypothetical protein [Saccharopolyspora sp. CA-218241]|uniref:hypothetical protein n=1 Tax=Saccharopolyspora sp. CA-218241 TaxID=3240027 RepID=UPI003D98371D